MKIPKEQINTAAASASSYLEFKENLEEMGYTVPMGTTKFPANMKGWGRKLRYETPSPEPFTAHDRRKAEYYNRLERLGYPEPLFHMHK